MWNFTLDIITFLTAFSKPQKIFKNMYQKNLEKPSKTTETIKDLFPGSLGQDMSVARVAENSKGERRCLDECQMKCLYVFINTTNVDKQYINQKQETKRKQTNQKKNRLVWKTLVCLAFWCVYCVFGCFGCLVFLVVCF